MANQQAILVEAISAMKRAVARADDASESDDSIDRPTNRGNKLKRKAKYVQQGQLSQADGPRAYKRRLAYNGYSRYVISQKPPRVDPDGDIIDDEDEANSELSAAEEDPYAEVRIEDVLMPLASAADLDKHPALSQPYKSTALQEMEHHVQETLHREQTSLWRMKNLLVHFRGDETWIPCGMMETENDASLLQTQDSMPAVMSQVSRGTWSCQKVERKLIKVHKVSSEKGTFYDNEPAHDAYEQPLSTANSIAEPLLDGGEDGIARTSIASVDHAATSAEDSRHLNGHVEPSNEQTRDTTERDAEITPNNMIGEPESLAVNTQMTNGDNNDPKPPLTEATSSQPPAQERTENTVPDDEADGPQEQSEAPVVGSDENADQANEAKSDTSERPPHRMTTRHQARAQANGSTSHTPGSRSQSTSRSTSPPATIHPFFVAPQTAYPHTLIGGLSSPVAEETRRLLSVYVQKQEEIVRQNAELLRGLQKALRLKQMVWRWCRAEAHVGEMSDGEDWIDQEEWGLEGPLKKGEEVEDDEVYATAGKKTRNRRAAA
ncbi:MAG: hypothetical protein M1828_006475 [Chrysothrix sp. TS-e1954]|nr:MAG: hypothetical protein M1828_006475 [Chrysothrix sp. TS-e1954]